MTSAGKAGGLVEVHHVDRPGELAAQVSAALALDEAGAGEAQQRPRCGVLADPELEGDTPHVGERQQPAVAIETSVEGDLFENAPRRGPELSAGLAGTRSNE